MPSPYNYQFDDVSLTYVFTTKNSIEYRVAFIIDPTLSLISNTDVQEIFQVILEKNAETKEPLDHDVSLTICEILSAFFKNKKNSLVYICDNADGRAIARFRKFNIWYTESGLSDQILKFDNVLINELIAGSEQVYISLLIHCEHEKKEELVTIFRSMEQLLNHKS